MRSNLRSILTGAGFILAALCVARADDDEQSTDALAVAKTWLHEIDSGSYDQSYTDGGSALHDKVPQDTWIRILKAERPELGKVVTRTETEHSLRPNGFEGTEGEFFLVSFHTAFETKPNEIEHVVLRREDGHWRGVGYDFGPGEVVSDPDAGPSTTTTDQTMAPPTPTNGITVPAKRKAN